MTATTALVSVGIAAALALPLGGSAHRKTEQGNRLYAEGAFDEALRAYTEAQVAAPESPELVYDIGNVLYRQEDYEGAAEAYTRALAQLGSRPELEGAAAYNLGNARYRLGEYDAAVEAYERALGREPSDADAKRNLELALRALEAQEREEDRSGGEDQEESPTEPRPRPGDQEQEGEPEGERGAEPPRGAQEESPQDSGGSQAAGRMTEEQARRMLDGLEEQEEENLRQDALREVPARSGAAEKDW
jgi:Ca-activated chloride channel family protein